MKDTFKYISKNRTALLPFAILLFLAVATFLTLILTKQRQDIRPKAVADNGQLTFANLTPATVNPGSTFSVSVNMTGGGQVVVGADILVQFDSTKLTLTNITQNTATSNPYKTYAPVNASGAFDTARVVSCANSVGTNCPSGIGVAEFGIVSFDWTGNALTSPNATNSNLSPVTTLTFQVKTGAAAGASQLIFRNNGITATTDSNIVVNPAGGGDPEDILQAPGYPNDNINVTIGGVASPVPTPRATPRATPAATPPQCTARSCQDYNNDGLIRVAEIQSIAFLYGVLSGQPTYNAIYDLNCDGRINVADIQSQAFYYNISCTP